MSTYQPDLLIFGGGIAGLWTLLRARRAGYQALLLESAALGGLQSIASQGIIHGGSKYALKGGIGKSTQAIADMPGIWRDALAGKGALDLSAARVLSPHQHLWSSGGIRSSLAGVFASKLMQGKVASLARAQFPPPFDVPDFHGSLYALQEPVLDVSSLLRVMREQALPACYRYDPEKLQVDDGGLRIGQLRLQPRRVLLAAGEGNAGLLERWGMGLPQMQKRPLHMVMLKGPLPALYTHCLGASAVPRLTVTSYPLGDGEMLWYLGGQLAEEGVTRTPAQQIAVAKSELAKLLPWMDFSRSGWATLEINRAEVATPGGKRPDDCYLGGEGPVMVAWPTKLAFAPRLADLVLQKLNQEGLKPEGEEAPVLSLPHPPLASLPWEQVDTWS
ncbi:FAD-dependent oxidoreductase [Thiolapillus sp.]